MLQMRITILILIITLVSAFSSSASIDDNSHIELHQLLSQANETFQQANQSDTTNAPEIYIKAAKLYEKAASFGEIENAKLYYNIGNCYLLANDLGKAIYNYKKAVKLDPSDPLLQRNLAVARSKRIDKIDAEIEHKVLTVLCFWHYDFLLKTRFYVAVFALSAFLLLLTIKIWKPFLAGFTAISVCLVFIFVLFAGSVTIEMIRSKTNRQGVIVAAEVVARQGDSQRYEPSFDKPLHSGTEFELIEKRTGWLRVRLADGSKVWLPDSACLLI